MISDLSATREQAPVEFESALTALAGDMKILIAVTRQSLAHSYWQPKSW